MDISDNRPDPDELLASIIHEEERSKKGKLKIYFRLTKSLSRSPRLSLPFLSLKMKKKRTREKRRSARVSRDLRVTLGGEGKTKRRETSELGNEGSNYFLCSFCRGCSILWENKDGGGRA